MCIRDSLIYLQKYFPESSILHLDKKSQFDPSILKMNILFIDSIHHFNFFQRKQIYTKVPIVILTTHFRRSLEYIFLNKEKHSFQFKGLDKNTLITVLDNRIQSAMQKPYQSIPRINDSYIDHLLKKYGDDFRAILNTLYTNFQNTSINGK